MLKGFGTIVRDATRYSSYEYPSFEIKFPTPITRNDRDRVQLEIGRRLMERPITTILEDGASITIRFNWAYP